MDDLLDLDWDRKPAPPAHAQQQQQRSQVGRNGNTSSYNFDALSRSLPQSSINRSGNGNTARPGNGGTTSAGQRQGSKAPSSDAFSSLLGFENGHSSGSSLSKNNTSMAERLKKEHDQKLGMPMQTNATQQPSRGDNSAWEGLDSFLGAGSTSVSSKAVPKAQSPVPNNEDDLWSFSSPPAKDAPSVATAKTPVRTSNNVETSSSKPAKAVDPFDFTDFEDPGASQSSALGSSEATKARARPAQKEPAHQFLENSDDEDDILGSLGRTGPPRPQPQAQRPAEVAVKKPQRGPSPPPHIIGQIVEMGFSPLQARQALADTASGLDVTAAIEKLLSGSERKRPGEERRYEDRRSESDHQMAARLQREEGQRQRQERRGPRGQQTETDEVVKSNGLDIPVEWQKQADQIYSQASEIGASVFSKANAFWSTAKAQAQRAIDERSTGGNESGQSSGRSSPAGGSERAKNRRWAVGTRDGGGQRKEWQGKPKWMVEAEDGAEEEKASEAVSEGNTRGSKGGFRDDEDEDGAGRAAPFVERKQAAVPSRGGSAADLWGNEEEDGRSLKAQAASTSKRSSPSLPASDPIRAASSPKPVRRAVQKAKEDKIHRHIVQDSASSIQSSLQFKQRGNELFKRGAYGEAEVAYSNGLGALEENPQSFRRVPLLNNRANARLRNGDARSALNDTKEVLTLIVVEENKRSSPFLLYRPSREHPLPGPELAEVNLRDGYAKALLRRAQAEEMLEQWETAKSVWTLLEKYEKEEGSGKSGVTNLRASQDGSRRCSKMLSGGDVELTAPATKRVHAAAVQAIAKAEKMAKERIRSENAVAAAEEAEKDQLRDSVDGRVLAWKAGKESNVRALLASLQDVVWPGLNWKRVGMHELVMDNQVKRCYMRAIGKLHPDKLTPKTNNIEERMIGGAVFSVLNDAWSAANAS